MLWKIFYANHCFVEARAAAEHVYQKKLESNAPLFYPLVVAIYTLYARPFTRSDGVGRLDEPFIPHKCLAQHQLIMEHRNQIYAHRDADAFSIDVHGSANQLRAVRTDTVFGLAATNVHARYHAMLGIIEICNLLEKKCGDKIGELWKKHKGKVPPQEGEYLLNVLDATGPMWLPKQRMLT